MHFTLRKLSIGAIALLLAPLSSTLMSQSALAGQVFEWKQGAPSTPMISARTGVCFLTSIQGKFEGGKERVALSIENGQWFLGGSSDQSGVAGEANCVLWNELLVSGNAIYGPYNWNQYEKTTSRKLDGFNEGDGFCFLGSVSGKFRGGGERVEVTLDPSSREWVLNVNSNQGGVSASAYCIPTVYNYTLLTAQFNWSEYGPDYNLGSGYASCFLTGMTGKFQGGREKVRVYDNFGEWYFEGTSDQEGVGASARCYKK